MTIDPRDRFTGLAATYRRRRPPHPEALFDRLVGLFAAYAWRPAPRSPRMSP